MSTDKPDFSDVRSGSGAVAPGKADFSDVRTGSSTAQGGGGGGEQTYTVVSGDTLSHISKHFYGHASHWEAIFAANRDQLDDPDRIRPGQVLRIPPHDHSAG